jgi:hypothetical protein
MRVTERREHTDRRQMPLSADDLHRQLKEKIAAMEMERRQGSRRQIDQPERRTPNDTAQI